MSGEQVVEENNQGATRQFLSEQGDSKNDLGSSEKLTWGALTKAKTPLMQRLINDQCRSILINAKSNFWHYSKMYLNK